MLQKRLTTTGLIPEDDSVRLLSHVLEGLDYTNLYLAYSAKDRNPAVDPKTMFKVLTYAYSQGIYSSRKVERACRRDINFMWLLAGQKAPDHSTIVRFRTGFLASLSGTDGKAPIVLYNYAPGRSGDYPIEFLSGFSGMIHCDGYSAYRRIEDVILDAALHTAVVNFSKPFLKNVRRRSSFWISIPNRKYMNLLSREIQTASCCPMKKELHSVIVCFSRNVF